MNRIKNLLLISILFFAALVINSCRMVELSSSWSNKNVPAKPSPKILVMAVNGDLANRQFVEQKVVDQFKKKGFNALVSADLFSPKQNKIDSITMVNTLRTNKVDVLLTLAVVNKTEKETYVPGTTTSTPVVTYPTYGGVQYQTSGNYGYYDYYGYRNNYNNYTYYYQSQPTTQYQTTTTEGYTETAVEVLVESNLYDVNTADLLWIGQSKAFTDEISTKLVNQFATSIIDDLQKKNLIKP